MDLTTTIFADRATRQLEEERAARRRSTRRGARRAGRLRQRVERLEHEVVELAGVLQVVLKRLEEKGLFERAELAELVRVATVELAEEQGVRIRRRRRR